MSESTSIFLLSMPALIYTGRHHSIGACPNVESAALICENGRLPKNPRLAESGDGCAAVITV